QYYEEDDPVKTAFGRELTMEEWTQLADITTTYQNIRFNSPLIGVNLAHPMLIELLSEIQNSGRKFSFICGHDSNIATVLGALGVTDYELPGTIERRTPIGVKLVFEKWVKGEEEFARVRLIYQSTEQLRDLSPLSLDNPPVSFTIGLPGLRMNEEGFYRLDEVTGALQSAIDCYDMLSELYADDVELEDAA
ncbi:MAG: histidine-type phosphatase, partial [Thermoguttaceae bacterium]|nr:histidine-type phosphatase [Thermoguttaceae bacterium]